MDWIRLYHGGSIQNREEHKRNERPVPDTKICYVQKGKYRG